MQRSTNSTKGFFGVVFVLAILSGVLVSGPQWMHMVDPRYQGILVGLSPDEGSYQTHLQEALLGRIGQAGKGITAASQQEPSFHLSPIEEVEGFLFSWTGMNAAEVFQVMDFFVPFLLTIALVVLLLSLGFSHLEASLGTILFIGLQLANLNRPVHPRESLLLLVIALLSFQLVRTGSGWWAIVGGMMLGILLGTYIWGWMAAWCVLLVMIALLLACRRGREVGRLLVTGIFGIVCASPFVWQMLSIRSHPAYADAVERTGLTHWRWPESLPWSGLFLVMAVCMVIEWYRRGRRVEEVPVVALAVSGFIVFNQQLVHGALLMFRAHFLLFLTLVAVCVLLRSVRSVWSSKSLPSFLSAFAAVIILCALAWENRKVGGQWSVDAGDFAHQHLSTALPVLESLPRSVILSDPGTSVFLSGSTKHDVVFTDYLQHTLVTHEQAAEAFCLTQIPVPPEQRRLAEHSILALGNAIWSERDPPRRAMLRAQDLLLTEETCTRIDAQPRESLKNADVSYIFWNSKEVPEWDPSRLPAPLEHVASGSGWVLWKEEF